MLSLFTSDRSHMLLSCLTSNRSHLRTPLEALVLQTKVLTGRDPRTFRFIEPPPLEVIDNALNNLKSAQVLDNDFNESVTPLGQVSVRDDNHTPLTHTHPHTTAHTHIHTHTYAHIHRHIPTDIPRSDRHRHTPSIPTYSYINTHTHSHNKHAPPTRIQHAYIF